MKIIENYKFEQIFQIKTKFIKLKDRDYCDFK